MSSPGEIRSRGGVPVTAMILPIVFLRDGVLYFQHRGVSGAGTAEIALDALVAACYSNFLMEVGGSHHLSHAHEPCAVALALRGAAGLSTPTNERNDAQKASRGLGTSATARVAWPEEMRSACGERVAPFTCRRSRIGCHPRVFFSGCLRGSTILRIAPMIHPVARA